ncbi:aliphatic sulfonate ABC transporter substrate-binding protein [Candidatus Pantoea deserta]|uniref:Aliphatic sulfonate ABC transporter substrate-binding protein n=1 Tax=Candidatus Pantoea deserta TaxID=1869313 RepID=A0A3N4NCV5_9GAMM|nr:ABC transporter substrate-binding protein [Pantoea deserta]RPD94011.1 aliphatic sulfonate ABC transporter substrate-binding protein [Pantoea deserta]
MEIRIGSHPSNLSLFILRHRGVLENLAAERGWRIAWTDYTQGARSGEWLARGQLDVVGTGSTPPVNAQAGGLDVAYLASSPPRDASCALLTKRGRALPSLKGLRLSAMIGSFTDHFLARLLHKQQLRRSDVELVDIQGEAALEALLAEEIDGWLAIDPWLTRARSHAAITQLASVGDEIVNRSLFWTRADWLEQHPHAADWVVEQLQHNDRWIESHPQLAAQLLTQHIADKVTVEEWQTALRARPWGIAAADESLIAEQQQQADDLYAAGFIPAAIHLQGGKTS